MSPECQYQCTVEPIKDRNDWLTASLKPKLNRRSQQTAQQLLTIDNVIPLQEIEWDQDKKLDLNLRHLLYMCTTMSVCQ